MRQVDIVCMPDTADACRFQEAVTRGSLSMLVVPALFLLDGVRDVLEARKKAGELNKPAKERYHKHVKSFVQVGNDRSDLYATPLGYPAEIMTLTNFYTLNAGATLQVTTLVDGKPAGNQYVLFDGEIPGKGGIEQRSTRSNAQGIASIPLTTAGVWYIKFINMAKVTRDSVDYKSKWATLTFEVRSRLGEWCKGRCSGWGRLQRWRPLCSPPRLPLRRQLPLPLRRESGLQPLLPLRPQRSATSGIGHELQVDSVASPRERWRVRPATAWEPSVGPSLGETTETRNRCPWAPCSAVFWRADLEASLGSSRYAPTERLARTGAARTLSRCRALTLFARG